jgi:hypothetical protein
MRRAVQWLDARAPCRLACPARGATFYSGKNMAPAASFAPSNRGRDSSGSESDSNAGGEGIFAESPPPRAPYR